MKDWLRISLILCTFGFFREMRPSEPFVTEFLSGEWRNITSEQVNREIYPLGTYSYLAQLIIIFLITDILRYKPIIVLSSCIGIILWSLLLWTYTLLGLQFVQICYGTFMAAEVAYYTYIYAKVDRSKYQQVTGHTRSAILGGRFLASVLAQLIVSYNLMDLRELNYISLGAQIISLFLAVLLPSVETSLYFYAPQKNYGSELKPNDNHIIEDLNTNIHQIKESNLDVKFESSVANLHENGNDSLKPKFSFKRATDLLIQHITGAYTNPKVIQWSIWWSLAMCGFLQVQSYVQLLWKEIDPNQENFYNGAVEAALTILGALGAFLAGFLNSGRYKNWDMAILTICSLIEGGFVLISAFTENVWIAYIMYILFGILYHFMITIASATVAKKLHADSFGLIFGINTLLALIFQTILTVVVVSESGFQLGQRAQFIVFGGYFIVLAILYGITGIFLKIRKLQKS